MFYLEFVMKKLSLLLLFLMIFSSLIYAYKEDAIIVLGCGLLEKKSTSRILKAIDECDPETKYIIFAGKGIEKISEADYLQELYFKYNKECLAVPLKEVNSYTTISNAFNTMSLIKQKDIKSVTVVTSKDHFYAPIIFNFFNFVNYEPIEIQFSYSDYTRND